MARTSHGLHLLWGYGRRGSGTNGGSAARRVAQSEPTCPVRRTSPRWVLKVRLAVSKLSGLHFGELLNQGFIDDKVLVAVFSWRLVLMFADALLQELRHPEVWIAQQGRNAHDRSYHLSIERSAAVAYQEVWLLTVYQFTDESDCLLWVHRQVGRYHLRTSSESLAQSHCRYALATGIESV